MQPGVALAVLGCVDRSHMKATCGNEVEDCVDGSLVCFLYWQEQILPLHRAGKALCTGERHAASQGMPRNMEGWPAAPLTPEGQLKDILYPALWPRG